MLCDESKIIIKINQHRIFNNAVVIIDSFREYWDSKKDILRDSIEIEKATVNAVLGNTDEQAGAVLCQAQQKLVLV